MSRNLICLCNLVGEHEIEAALRKGAVTSDQVKAITGAGTGCGRCVPALEKMVAEHRRAASLQSKLFPD